MEVLNRESNSQQGIVFNHWCPFFPVLATCICGTTVLAFHSCRDPPPPSCECWESLFVDNQQLTTFSPFRQIALLWNCRKTFISCLHLVESPEKLLQREANEYKIDKVKGENVKSDSVEFIFSVFKSLKHRHSAHVCRSQTQKLKDGSEYESYWATLGKNADACHLHRWHFLYRKPMYE